MWYNMPTVFSSLKKSFLDNFGLIIKFINFKIASKFNN